jgi:hypothetical protein
MTYTYCCVYSNRLLMMDRKPVRIAGYSDCLLASSQHNMYDIHLLLCIQYYIPDDGQKTCPKHVEFYSKNKFEKLVHLVGFIIRIYHDARTSECQIRITYSLTISISLGEWLVNFSGAFEKLRKVT